MPQSFLEFFTHNSFFFELFIAYVLFARLLKREKYFVMKMVICSLAGLAFSTFTPLYFEFEYVPESADFLYLMNNIYAMGRFAVSFILSVICIKICFKVTVWNAIFIGVSAYCTQHIFHRLNVIPGYYFFWLPTLTGNLDAAVPEFVNYILYWGLMLIVYAAAYLIYVRRLINEPAFKTDNKKLITISFFIIIVTVVLSFLGYMYTYWNETLINTPVEAVLSAFSIITCIITLENLFSNATNKKMEREISMIQTLWKSDRRLYEISKQNMELMNIKYHDLKKMAGSMLDNEDAKREISESLDLYASMLRTNNETLDVVLTEKSLLANKTGIYFASIIDGDLINFMKPVDIYSLFGNAVDNAIECLKDVVEDEKKVINIMVKKDRDMVRIQIENYLPAMPVMIDSLPQTTKNDTRFHGFGLKSIKYLVEKYKGYMHINTDNNKFSLIVMLPLINN